MFELSMSVALLIVAVTYFLGLFLMLYVNNKHKNDLKNIGNFTLYYLVGVIGILLIVFRTSLSTVVSVIIANFMLIASKLILLRGISAFYDKKVKDRYLLFSLILFVILFMFFTYININVTARIIIYTLTAFCIHTIASIIIYISNKKRKLKQDIMLPINIYYTFYYIVRMMTVIVTRETFVNFFDYNYDAYLVALDGLFAMVLIVGVLSLVNRKFTERLKESEFEYRSLFNHAGFGIGYYNPEGKVLWYNQVAAKNMGGKPEDFQGKTFYDLFTKENADKYMTRLQEAKNFKEPIEYEDYISLPIGEVYYRSVYNNICNSKNEIIGIEVISSDITQLKKYELSLRESEKNFKSMYEEAPLPYQSLDGKGNFITVNNAWLELFGYKREEVIGKWFGDFIHPDFVQYLESKFPEFVDKGVIFTEYDIPKKNGEILKIHNNGRVGYNDDGSFKQTHCIMRDVTQQLKIEKLIVDKEKEQRLILEEMQIGIIVHDKDTSVIFCNKLAEEIFELPRNVMLGKQSKDKIWNFIDKDNKKLLEKNYPVTRILRTKIELISYIMGIKINNENDIRWLSVSGIPIYDKDSDIERVVLSFLDITDRKNAEENKEKLERQLRNRQKLESIGTLASGVAHEINNPINGIMNYGQIILDSDSKNPIIKDSADEIIHETKRVASIVNNLLDFSRQNTESYSKASIDDILEQTLSLLRTIIRQDQIVLDIKIDKNLPEITCKNQQIQQVLMNLLTNARDALNDKYKDYNENKKIKVLCEKISRQEKEWIRITIEDYGNGIPKSIQDKIFDPFFTTKDRTKGTGLGLSISYGIIQEHGGELSFETNEGDSTKFIVNLPIQLKD